MIDPVFLAELEHVIQDVGMIHLESQLSKDVWPDRPSHSVPSIFKKRKFIISSMNKHSSTENSGKHRRGRPKKSSTDKSGDKAEKQTNAEQRLPLKKRHLHNAQTQNSSEISGETLTTTSHR